MLPTYGHVLSNLPFRCNFPKVYIKAKQNGFLPHLAQDHLGQLDGVHPPHVDVHRVLLDVRAGVAVPATAHQNVQ